MRSILSNLLLLLFLANTFGFGLFEIGLNLSHWLPNVLYAQQQGVHATYHVHLHGQVIEIDHPDLVADHSHEIEENVEEHSQSNPDLLIAELFNYPLIKPESPYFRHIRVPRSSILALNHSKAGKLVHSILTPPPEIYWNI